MELPRCLSNIVPAADKSAPPVRPNFSSEDGLFGDFEPQYSLFVLFPAPQWLFAVHCPDDFFTGNRMSGEPLRRAPACIPHRSGSTFIPGYWWREVHVHPPPLRSEEDICLSLLPLATRFVKAAEIWGNVALGNLQPDWTRVHNSG